MEAQSKPMLEMFLKSLLLRNLHRAIFGLTIIVLQFVICKNPTHSTAFCQYFGDGYYILIQ